MSTEKKNTIQSYEDLKPFATPKQVQMLNAIIEANGNQKQAARNLGLSYSLSKMVHRLRVRAAKTDPSLHEKRAPEGYKLRGVSTLVDASGNKVMQWVKTSKEHEEGLAILEAFREAVESDPLPKASKVKDPKTTNSDLLCMIPIGDAHFGMLSWAAETGEDYDLKIARAYHLSAIEKLVDLSPPAETCVILNLGDGLHSDGYGAMTTKGTRVDVDSRWPKMLQVFIETMNECALLAAAKHKKVIVVNVSGNHDSASSIMVSLCQAAYFKDNPRIEVVTNPGKFHYFEHGKCLIGTTHGDSVKFEKLAGIMATDQAEAWGRTLFRQFYCGHIHSSKVLELPGCLIETFRTLAAKDAWSYASGYRAGRSISCDVWHKDRGRILRHEIGVESL